MRHTLALCAALRQANVTCSDVQATSFENYVPDTGHACGDVARDGLYLAKPSGRLSPVHGMLRTAIIFYNP
jgi:hypothetical protein